MATEYRQRPGMGDHFDDEDLVMSSAQQRRNWRGILIALMVIVAVLAMIVTSVVLLTPPQPEELLDSYSNLGNGGRDGSDYYYNQRANDELWWRRRGMRALRLSDLLVDSANIKIFNGTWISGNEIFYITGSGDLAIMKIMADTTIQTTSLIMSKQMLQELKGRIISLELSPDRNHVLIGHDAKKLFRYSKTARYTVYTVSTGQMTPIIMEDHHHRNGTNATDLQPYLLHAQWHKISSLTNQNIESMALIAVYRYDVFYIPWSLKLSVSIPDTEKINITMDSQKTNTTNSQTPPSSTPTLIHKHINGEINSTSPKPLWKPWSHGPVRRITTSGSGTSTSVVGIISNGVADYLYEMEILKKSPAVWPSSGRYLVYATFDDRRVGDYKYSVYMKNGKQRDNEDENRETEKHSRQQKQQRKKKRRRRRTSQNAKFETTADTKTTDETSNYYLYPKIRTIKYPKANTPNPTVTLSVIVNLDQLKNPQVQPKIRTLTPPPYFQYTDDYYLTAVQWVNNGGTGGSHEVDDDKSGTSPAEVCVVWLNRAQNTSVTTLCKSPMWICQETQVINAVGAGGGSGSGGGDGLGGGQASDSFYGGRPLRRYPRGDGGSREPAPETADGENDTDSDTSGNASSTSDRHRRRQTRQHGQRQQRSSHRGRRRRAEDVARADGGNSGPARRRRGGWVDAAVGGAGGGVPSTGGGVDDAGDTASSSAAAWWTEQKGDAENFAGDDGYAGVAGVGGSAAAAGYAAAVLVRRGWETGDKELTPRVPVFAADGQGYVSVAPVRDDGPDDGGDGGEGGVRLRRPSSPKQRTHDRGGKGRTPAGRYYPQVVAVNITKKLLSPLTFGEPNDGGGGEENENDKKNSDTKSWSVVRILAWDQRTDMIYFLAVPSGRGAPHHRHLYAVKFTSPASSLTVNTDASSRAGHHYQQYRKTVRHSTRNRPICLSCDNESFDNTQQRKRRDNGGKQNRMDEARDDRLRQQQRERWEHQKEEEDDAKEAMTAEEAERRQQRNRRQETQSHGTTRHCTYYDAQFSHDGSHYALVCLGPSVPYVTLHRIVLNDKNDDINNDRGTDEVDSLPLVTQKWPKNFSYSFEFIALVENNTRLQDKYTNRVLLPGTRTFQLRLSGGRKLTTSGGLHFDDPLAAADYYSNGGGQQLHFSSKKRPDSDPLTVAQVRLYLPLSVYDPEADPRPEFMLNHASNSDKSNGKDDMTNSKSTPDTNYSPLPTQNHHRRRRSSSSVSSSRDNKENNSDGPKRQRRPHKQQRPRRYKKLYPMIVVVNSDPGSQAITDRFSDRLSYTTGLLCSGSLGKTLPSGGGGKTADATYNGDHWDRRNQKGRRNRRSTATQYYSSNHLDNTNDGPYDYDQYDNEDLNNNEYVVAVIDPGRGTWARGYESLLALNYGDVNDEYGSNYNGEDNELGGLLGTADIRDQMEAVEYLLSSASTTNDNYKDDEQGYYTEDRPRGGRGSRDRSRWFSSTSQSNRRYYSDDDDDDDDEYYDNDVEYTDNSNENANDYYYYYYSNGGGNSDYGGSRRGDDFHRDDDGKRTHRDRRSTSDTKTNTETLRLPYVDATRVAVLGGGPTSPSTPSSIYGGYAAGRMALWQSIYGGAPIEKKSVDTGNSENRKEPVAIHSSFKCAVTMAPVCSWRLYASAFAERYYGYYNRNNADNWTPYDRSDLIPLTTPLNDSSFSPSSNGKGINLLVMHGTADTTIHPQHSMMLVRGVMQQQQQQYMPTSLGGNSRKRNNNNISTSSGGRVTNGFPFRTGPIRISQLVMPDVDLSNSRMASGTENNSPINHQYQLLYSIYGHITQYLANECFTGVNDGIRGQGVRIRGRPLQKRRRRRWRAGNRGQNDPGDQREKEHHPQYQQNQRSVSGNDKNDFSTSGDNGDGDRNHGNSGRYRRHDIDNSKQIMNSFFDTLGNIDGKNSKINKNKKQREHNKNSENSEDDDSDKDYDDGENSNKEDEDEEIDE